MRDPRGPLEMRVLQEGEVTYLALHGLSAQCAQNVSLSRSIFIFFFLRICLRIRYREEKWQNSITKKGAISGWRRSRTLPALSHTNQKKRRKNHASNQLFETTTNGKNPFARYYILIHVYCSMELAELVQVSWCLCKCQKMLKFCYFFPTQNHVLIPTDC